MRRLICALMENEIKSRLIILFMSVAIIACGEESKKKNLLDRKIAMLHFPDLVFSLGLIKSEKCLEVLFVLPDQA